MKRSKGIFGILKDTTWPTPKQAFRDYISILQYTAFFAVIIFLFDKFITVGLLDFISRF